MRQWWRLAYTLLTVLVILAIVRVVAGWPLAIIEAPLILSAALVFGHIRRTSRARIGRARDRCAILERRVGPLTVGEELLLSHREAIRQAGPRAYQ